MPLKPLAPRTRYAFIVTNRVRSTAGVAAGADLVFGAVRDAHLAGLTSVPGQPALTPLFPADHAADQHRRRVSAYPGNSVVVAWSMQTQSITDVLDVIDATTAPRPAVLASAGHHDGAARPRPAGHREHLHGLPRRRRTTATPRIR